MTARNETPLTDVYRKRLLELFRRPLGTGKPDPAARRGWARNRTCGDEVTFHSLLAGDRVSACHQHTDGCAIATATASLLTAALPSLPRAGALDLLRALRQVVESGAAPPPGSDLEILSAVHDLPSRHECATVALDAAEASLRGEGGGG
ncbi:MAG: iron-sulfur cluster assembly scaffold protein [Puniceicoccaceae bacterium]